MLFQYGDRGHTVEIDSLASELPHTYFSTYYQRFKLRENENGPRLLIFGEDQEGLEYRVRIRCLDAEKARGLLEESRRPLKVV